MKILILNPNTSELVTEKIAEAVRKVARADADYVVERIAHGPEALESYHDGQGLATEVSAALTRVAFEIDQVDRVEIHCEPQNVRSAAVPRKLGYQHEATLARRLRTMKTDPSPSTKRRRSRGDDAPSHHRVERDPDLRAKLQAAGQADRIEGMTPAALMVLSAWLSGRRKVPRGTFD